jgi:hypothetical protein
MKLLGILFLVTPLLLLSLAASAQVGMVVGGFLGTKDAPFSADIVFESKRIQADGSSKASEKRIRFYRDSQGRTRGETVCEPRRENQEPCVTISDPIAGLFIELDLRTRTAKVAHANSLLSPPPAAAPSEEPKPWLKTEPIQEKRTIEGYAVVGTRSSFTMPASPQSPEKPVTVVTESWYSPELKVPLMTTSGDLRSGQSITLLTNIRKGDPDPQLFQVPPDYTVKEVPISSN